MLGDLVPTTAGARPGPADLDSRSSSSGCPCDAAQFADLTRAVGAAEQIRDARATLVRGVSRLLDTPWVALTRCFDDDEVGFVGLAGDAARRASRAEQRLRQGPACDVHEHRRLVAADDLAADDRWPEYRRALVAETAIRSLIAVPMFTGRELLGAFVAYADRASYFSGDRRHRADLLGAYAGAALAGVAARVKAANLEVALRTNREIGTAVGIVMDRMRLTDEQSFTYLRELSQRRHLKLSELAERIVVTGEIPELPIAS